MKKVVLEKEETVELTNVDPRKYYGVLRSCGSKGFITRRNYREGLYSAYCCEGVTRANSWNLQDSDTLDSVIKKLIDILYFKVYEFDTAKELFTWLAE